MNKVIMTCPHCGHQYQLGIDGAVDGCDACLNISRNPIDHTIITQPEEVDLLNTNAVDWAEEVFRQDRAIRVAQRKA